MKKGLQSFFTCAGLFFEILFSRFYEIGQSKKGEGSKTYFTLPSITYDLNEPLGLK